MEKNTIKKRTAVRKEIIHLPGETKLIHSNRLTNGKYKGFTLVQAKVFISVIKELQLQIRKTMSGEIPFPEVKSDTENVTIQLSLKDLASPKYYKQLIHEIDELRSLGVEIPPPEGFKKSVYSVIIGYDEPYLKGGKKVLNLHIANKVAQQLVTIDKNSSGTPIEYHNYTFEVIMNSTNKYTWKLYLLISSWKNKGGFKITYQKLREILGIEDGEYKRFVDFKRRVLVPVQRELEGKADCWFNCSEAGFEIREGKEVVMLNFKIITPVLEEHVEEWRNHIISLLRSNYHCNISHIKAIQPILERLDEQLYISVKNKLMLVNELIYKRNGTAQQIEDVASYVVKALLAEFSPKN